jgi:hypothetical protein
MPEDIWQKDRDREKGKKILREISGDYLGGRWISGDAVDEKVISDRLANVDYPKAQGIEFTDDNNTGLLEVIDREEQGDATYHLLVGHWERYDNNEAIDFTNDFLAFLNGNLLGQFQVCKRDGNKMIRVSNPQSFTVCKLWCIQEISSQHLVLKDAGRKMMYCRKSALISRQIHTR